MTSYLTHIVCLECGHEMAAGKDFPAACVVCKSAWLDARYDYERVAEFWTSTVAQREHSLWRYGELLPISEPDPEISLGEGYTPLTRLLQYEKLYDHPYIFVKDERHQPTNSFKDRQAAMSVTYMRQQGITECVLASTGNAAVAYAAYCARAGIKLWLFLTSLAPAEKMREVALYSAEVVKVSSTYDETKHVAAEFAARRGLYMDKGAKTIPSKESMKTLGYEIAEQLGLKLKPGTGQWAAPDWYIQAVSGGIGPLGVMKGFQELYAMGLIDKIPKLGVVQAAGCAPMVEAFHAGKATADVVVPQTLVHVLATGDPGHAYVLLRQMILETGGTMVAIEDGETFAAMRHLASRAGISVEPATAVAFAGMEKMLADGTITPDEIVVINCSGHTMPAESHILGDQYDRYILNLDISSTSGEAVRAPHEEGLGAALQNLHEQVTTIVIVDDNPNDRRLVRRLLQSHKNYRVYEAANGMDGIEVIKDRKPDLVVTDLTMPEMDGFSLLETLKNDPETAQIPVVVVSAKALTVKDRALLDEYSESVWQKGGFDTRQLVDHVVSTLGHSPVESTRSSHRSQADKSAFAEHSSTDETLPTRQVIVMIDNHPEAMQLVRKAVMKHPEYHLVEARTGRDGLKAIYNYHPDLILLDPQLPDMDGFSMIDTLQRDMKLKDIPTVVFVATAAQATDNDLMPENIHLMVKSSSLDLNKIVDIIKNELK